jgi:hypothetical protein
MVKTALEGLAKEYERLRSQMLPGDERTVAMERVAKQMLNFALVIPDDLFLELKTSDSAGMRLALVLCLEMTPKLTELDWLVERIKIEKPFIGYHAALALRAAVRAFDASEYSRLRAAIDQALRYLQGQDRTDRFHVLSAARAELGNAS